MAGGLGRGARRDQPGAAFGWGLAFTDLVHGLPLSSAGLYLGSFGGLLAPVAIVGWLASLTVFLAHGATFLALKTAGPLAVRARRAAAWLSPPGRRASGRHRGWLEVSGSHGPGGLGGTVPVVLAIAAALVFAASGPLAAASRAGLWFGLPRWGSSRITAAVFTALFPRVMVSSGPGHGADHLERRVGAPDAAGDDDSRGDLRPAGAGLPRLELLGVPAAADPARPRRRPLPRPFRTSRVRRLDGIPGCGGWWVGPDGGSRGWSEWGSARRCCWWRRPACWPDCWPGRWTAGSLPVRWTGACC